MSKLRIILLLITFSCTASLFAQDLKVEGVIVDQESNETLIGATVLIKGVGNGTATDLDGHFSISAPKESTLIISYMGYASQEVVVKNENQLQIKLVPNNRTLQEAIVIGYGTQKVKDMTAPISSVKGNELSRQITANPMSALQGKMSGVQVINSGAPGAGPTVKIRGVGSIGDYASPLYIVDGVFVDNIDFLSSGDIEDLTVLKDASAAAIYGVRAANGVVLVTTKKGKIDQTNISYDGYAGVQIPVNIMKLASKNQYVDLLNEANADITGYIPKDASNYPTSTDWYSKLVRNAIMHSHAVDISGASDKSSYSLGLNYFYQEGIMNCKNDYQRYNIRARVDQKVGDWLNIGFNSFVSDYTKQLADENAFFSAFVNPPVYSVYDDTNTEAYPIRFGSPQKYGFGNQYGNPVATAYYNDNKENGLKLVLSTFAEINIIPEKLKFKTSYNMDFNFWKSRDYTPEFNVGGSQTTKKSTLSKTFGTTTKNIIDNLLTYNDHIDLHSFNILLGQSTRLER